MAFRVDVQSNEYVKQRIKLIYKLEREKKREEKLDVLWVLVQNISFRKREFINRPCVNGVEIPAEQFAKIEKLVHIIKNKTPEKYPLAQLIHAFFQERKGELEEAGKAYLKIEQDHPRYLEGFRKHHLYLLRVGANKQADIIAKKIRALEKEKQKEEEKPLVIIADMHHSVSAAEVNIVFDRIKKHSHWIPIVKKSPEGSNVEHVLTASSSEAVNEVMEYKNPIQPHHRYSPYADYSLFGYNPGAERFKEEMEELIEGCKNK